MANIFRSRVNNSNPVAVGLRVQSSVQGTPVPIGCGLTRWAPVLIDYAGFTATPAKSPGSKGGLVGASGKGNTGQYDYSASGLMMLGEGLVAQINTVYNGSYFDFLVPPSAQVQLDLNAMGIPSSDITSGNSYSLTLHTGTYTDTVDAFWNANYPTRALAYRGIAYLVIPNLGLGSSPSWPALTVEALWSINSDIPALGPDANPADWIQAFLTNADWGVPGFPSSAIGDFATARNYWRATGMLISLSLTSATAANSHLKSLMDALNCDFRWSGGASGMVLDIVPYGDVPVTGNGYTYTPNTTPIYALGPDDFVPNQGSLGQLSGTSFVAFERASVFDIFNKLQVEYLDRANLYNPVVLYQTDEGAIASQGRYRLSDLKQNHFFNLGSAASTSIALQLQRVLAGVNTYQCTVGRQFILLDPMDLVSITEPALQLVNQLCRVTEIQENADGTLTLTMEEVPLTAGAPLYNRQAALGAARNANSPPGSVNTPFFFEPPDALGDGLVLLIGLSGSNPANYGGCEVWISSDGTNYTQLGVSEGATRMGVTTASLPSFTAAPVGQTIDATNTLSVDLSESEAELISVSPTSFAALSTVSVVDGEVLAYENATLTGANAYNLTTLSRGAYGSTIAAHAAGAPFMRLDGSAYEWQFPSAYIGQKVYFKFLAFNAFGVATQSLADVGAYAFTVQGAALSSELPNVQNVYSNYEAGFQKIYWDQIEDFRSGILYEIRQGSTWEGAIPVAIQAHPPFIARGDGTYWIAARCVPITGLTVYSADPQSITVSGNWIPENTVFSFDEQATGWTGSLQNGIGIQGTGSTAYLRLAGSANILAEANVLADSDVLDSGGIITGTPLYYTSAEIVDAGYLAELQINVTAQITGSPYSQNILSVSDFLNYPDVLAATSAALIDGWVEIRTAATGSGPGGSAPPIWGAWQKFVPGVFLGRFVQFRLALESFDSKTIALALAFNWSVAVPTRVDHYQNQSIPSGGLTIVFQPDGATSAGAFNGGPNGAALPYVNVSWQATAGDTYTITGETLAQLTIQFFNGGSPVARSGVNIDVAGY